MSEIREARVLHEVVSHDRKPFDWQQETSFLQVFPVEAKDWTQTNGLLPEKLARSRNWVIGRLASTFAWPVTQLQTRRNALPWNTRETRVRHGVASVRRFLLVPVSTLWCFVYVAPGVPSWVWAVVALGLLGYLVKEREL